MDSIRTILASNMRRIRGTLTQSQVAVDCGFEVPSYNRWEKEKAWPDPGTIETLANYFKVDPSEFYRPISEAPLKVEPVKLSSFAKQLSNIPDDIFEMAQNFTADDEAWNSVRGVMTAEVMIKEKKKASVKKA